MDYPSAIEVVRRHKYPVELIVLHVRHGFTPGRTCGECSKLGEYWHHDTISPSCHLPSNTVIWKEEYPACG